MISYLKNKTPANRIMPEEDTATLVVSIYLNTIASSHAKQTERTRISCLFPQDLKNLNHIFEDHEEIDVTNEQSDNNAR